MGKLLLWKGFQQILDKEILNLRMKFSWWPGFNIEN